MHTLNLRLSPDEIGWIAADAGDRFLVVDDILLPLYRQFADKHAFEKVIVYPFSGAPVDTGSGLLDYEALLAGADPDALRVRRRTTRTTRCPCATRPAPPAGRRASSTRTARPCCTRWSAASARTGASGRTDVVLPVTPMFHANSWGMPYGAVMMGAKLVFPGPHLHPDDLLDLIKAEPPTLSLGVPTIWLGLIQRYEQRPDRGARPLAAARGHALAGRRLGGARGADPRLRPARRLAGAGLGHDRDLAAGDGLVCASERRPGRRALPPRRDGRRAGAAGRPAHPRRRRPRRAVGRQERRRDPGARAVHHRRVPRGAAERGQVHRRRLAAHRRRRGDGRLGPSSASPTAPRT